MNITGNYLIPDWHKLFPENFFSAYGMWNFSPNTPADKPKEDDTPPRSLNPLVGLAPSEIVKTLGDFGELRDSVSLFRRIEDAQTLGRMPQDFDKVSIQTRRSTPEPTYPVKAIRDRQNTVREETKQ